MKQSRIVAIFAALIATSALATGCADPNSAGALSSQAATATTPTPRAVAISSASESPSTPPADGPVAAIPTGFHFVKKFSGGGSTYYLYATSQYEKSRKRGVNLDPGPVIIAAAEKTSANSTKALKAIVQNDAEPPNTTASASRDVSTSADGPAVLSTEDPSTPEVAVATHSGAVVMTANGGATIDDLLNFAKGVSK